ncbi:hypothetical protein ACWGJ9_07485 [Curtobacterium citreum]
MSQREPMTDASLQQFLDDFVESLGPRIDSEASEGPDPAEA